MTELYEATRAFTLKLGLLCRQMREILAVIDLESPLSDPLLEKLLSILQMIPFRFLFFLNNLQQ